MLRSFAFPTIAGPRSPSRRSSLLSPSRAPASPPCPRSKRCCLGPGRARSSRHRSGRVDRAAAASASRCAAGHRAAGEAAAPRGRGSAEAWTSGWWSRARPGRIAALGRPMRAFADHFSRLATRYAALSSPVSRRIVRGRRRPRVRSRRRWDCATGTGQAALGLAGHFEVGARERRQRGAGPRGRAPPAGPLFRGAGGSRSPRSARWAW